MNDLEWIRANVPDQSGKTVLITGANSGIGFEAARVFIQRGAHVAMACRNLDKAREAGEKLMKKAPANADISILKLDLASLQSILSFTESFKAQFKALDVLINNAGVMALPLRRTQDGFEMQFGTNHLGHFALTGLLLDLLIKTENSRVVTVSSNAHKMGSMDFNDLNWNTRTYSKWKAYGQSKLANLLFTFELQRRLQRAAIPQPAVLACHPGYSSTNLFFLPAEMKQSSFMASATSVANSLFAQSALSGALPTLYAATSPKAWGGDYIGPDGLMELRGHPKQVKATQEAQDPTAGEKLWEASEELTGVFYDFTPPASS